MQPIIKIEGLSKQYRLGTIGTGTISNDLKRWWYNARGKEDPFLKIGESNDRSTRGYSDYVWALKDINLEVMPGEVLGIIGKNGAGKSTLLKILSKVTGPTTGSISFNGRIGSLLEVGTGFHPELTGRENIYLNGAILGMTKTEIKNKLDEIIDFSGCERYIDTPVKRYSSGMTVRLGFAVAAHLEPEILVVDEVLAVGDAEFQKKAIGKMQGISKNDGRTVLFVSHNMTNILQLCNSAILVDNGKIRNKGNAPDIIEMYQQQETLPLRSGLQNIKLLELKILTNNNEVVHSINTFDKVQFILKYDIKEDIDNVSFAICFNNSKNVRITSIWSSFNNQFFSVQKGIKEITFEVDSIRLSPDTYEIITYVESQGIILERLDNLLQLTVGFSQRNDFIQIPNGSQGHYIEEFSCKIN